MSSAIRWWKAGDHPAVDRPRYTLFFGRCIVCGRDVQDHGQLMSGSWPYAIVHPGDYIEPDGDGFRVRRAER